MGLEKSGNVVLVAGLRTAFVPALTGFAESDSLELLTRLIEGLLRRSDIPLYFLQQIVVGTEILPTRFQNLGREVCLRIRAISNTPAYTLCQGRLSGIKAIILAVDQLNQKSNAVALAAGVHCVSDTAPAYSREVQRFILRLTKAATPSARLQLIKSFPTKSVFRQTPATDDSYQENLAESYQLAPDQIAAPFTVAPLPKAEEIFPLWLPTRLVERDEPGKTYDGASAGLFATEEFCLQHGLKAQLRVLDWVEIVLRSYEKVSSAAIAVRRLLAKTERESVNIFAVNMSSVETLAMLKELNPVICKLHHLADQEVGAAAAMRMLNFAARQLEIGSYGILVATDNQQAIALAISL